MILELIKGVALLLALSQLQNLVLHLRRLGETSQKILSGVLFGGICIIGMMLPIEMTPGVIFDARSVVISMSGLFGGPIVGVIASLIAAGYRIWLGGSGVYVGVGTVIICVSLGLAYRHLHRKGLVKVGIVQLLVFGLIVHIATVLLFTQLPAEIAQRVMEHLAVPYVLTFAPATAILGMLLKDLDDRIETENALTESEARRALHIQNTPLAAISWDRDFCCTEWNKSAERIFGYTAEEAIGRRASDLIVPAEIRDDIKNYYGVLLENQEGSRSANANITKDGKTIFCVWYNTPIVDRNNHTIGVASLVQDLTDQKRSEEQLRQAQKMEAIGQLTGGIAHDFNNMLSVMLGNAEIIESDMREDRLARDRIEKLKQTIDRAASLTQRLLAFSCQQTLFPRSTDVEALIGQLEDMLRLTLGETIVYNFKAADDLWRAWVDGPQLDHALLNLAINARSAMPDGGTLTIEAVNTTLDKAYTSQHEDVTPGDYVRLSVSDTGHGMTREVMEHAFEPFYTTRDVGEGSGLGLSMVYGLIRQSGGHITISSEVDQGTTVTLYLPRAQKSATDEVDGVEPPEVTRTSARILVVEDDPNVREIPVRILRTEGGYEVVEAEDGEAAIEILKSDRPVDLLFTDVVLPGGMNGVAIAEEALRLNPAIKVLYATGYAENVVIDKNKMADGTTLLNKPYHRSELLEKVQVLLDSENG
ncbi:LytS/YhcK type 5TM receptor domain-containing protein [Breoghania sp. L-A4]|uniref:LytS/YhcK type 5TM receptor domain-containing protein n=1 Tax=Breoghania sp. L-A4 TaxID=2304600 RepID=UPI000E35C0D2|nr:LytS/YhcK type 5TM receptor domain-containing protein [Breoghania sp. L-A4]AXS40003.1 PAS domain S-box protein [Breoghania sp. L-A4]